MKKILYTQSGLAEHEKFTAALASVLSVDPKRIPEIVSQAKIEKPSPQTKYSYDPEG